MSSEIFVDFYSFLYNFEGVANYSDFLQPFMRLLGVINKWEGLVEIVLPRASSLFWGVGESLEGGRAGRDWCRGGGIRRRLMPVCRLKIFVDFYICCHPLVSPVKGDAVGMPADCPPFLGEGEAADSPPSRDDGEGEPPLLITPRGYPSWGVLKASWAHCRRVSVSEEAIFEELHIDD